MHRVRPPLARRLAALAVLAVGFSLAGCFNPFSPRFAPTLGASIPAPKPTSAPGVLRLFEWCYNNKAIAEYREIFSADYQFFFSPRDSAGAEWRGTPFRREDELISATQLFVGGSAGEPAARSINLKFDPNFFVYPDPDFTYFPEPNRTMPRDPLGRWHKNIRTTVNLRIGTDDGSSIEILGYANFYMIRGDSADIPEELKLLGFKPDSTRWYIRRWDDETVSEGGTLALVPSRDAGALAARRSLPAHASGPVLANPFEQVSWGAIKDYYWRTSGLTARASPQGP
jgi:hypothetical protein